MAHQSAHSPRTLASPRVRVQIRSIDFRPFAADDSVEADRELRVPIADQEPAGQGTVLDLPRQIAGLLGDPGSGRVRGAAGEMHPPRPQLDEEQDVDRLEEERLADEDVAGHDLVPVAREELAPGAAPALPLRCGRHVPALEDVPDGGAAHRVAQLDEFAVGARLAPSRVLSGQPEDQLDCLRAGGRAACARQGPERPLAPDQLPMPAEDGVRSEEQQVRVQAGTPAAQVGEPRREHGQRQLLPAREARRSGLGALQDGQLAVQQRDLDILALVRAQQHPAQVEAADQRHGSSGRDARSAVGA